MGFVQWVSVGCGGFVEASGGSGGGEFLVDLGVLGCGFLLQFVVFGNGRGWSAELVWCHLTGGGSRFGFSHSIWGWLTIWLLSSIWGNVRL